MDMMGGHILYQLSGTGDALIFKVDAKLFIWDKEDEDTRMKFF